MVVSACKGFGLTQLRSEPELHQVYKALAMHNNPTTSRSLNYEPARTHGTFLRNER
jgi:hypothetical protein